MEALACKLQVHVQVRDVTVARTIGRAREVEDGNAVRPHDQVGGTEVGVDRDNAKI